MNLATILVGKETLTDPTLGISLAEANHPLASASGGCWFPGSSITWALLWCLAADVFSWAAECLEQRLSQLDLLPALPLAHSLLFNHRLQAITVH